MTTRNLSADLSAITRFRLSRTHLVILFAAFAGAVFAFYRLTGLTSQFLRSESGAFLLYGINVTPPGYTDSYQYLTSSMFGHFTPVAFYFEMLQARLIGTRELAWFARSIALVCFLAGLVGAYVARAASMETRPAYGLGMVAAILFVMQPVMPDMISWPFMALQLECSALGLAGALFLVRYAQDARPRDLWLALGLAYLSMHFLGVGLAFSLAALGAATLVLLLQGAVPARFAPILVFGLLTLGHAVKMAGGGGGLESKPINAVAGKIVLRTLAMAWGMLKSGSLSLTAADSGLQFSYGTALREKAVYGAGWLTILAICLVLLVVRFRRTLAREDLVTLVTIALPMLFCLANSLLVAWRNASAQFPGEIYFDAFFVVPRYVFFSSLCVIMLAPGLARLLRPDMRVVGYAAPVVAMTAIVSNLFFMTSDIRTVEPMLFLSHRAVWKNVLGETRVALAEGRAIPNLARTDLGEFAFQPRNFEALIREELKVGEGAPPFVWEDNPE